jgi:hypothetical protein
MFVNVAELPFPTLLIEIHILETSLGVVNVNDKVVFDV